MLFDLFESQEIQNNVSENTRYSISLLGNVSGDVSLKEHSGYCQGRIRRGTEGALFYFPSVVLFPFSVLIFCLVCYVSLQGAREWTRVIYQHYTSLGWSVYGISQSGCQSGVCKEEVHWSKLVDSEKWSIDKVLRISFYCSHHYTCDRIARNLAKHTIASSMVTCCS